MAVLPPDGNPVTHPPSSLPRGTGTAILAIGGATALGIGGYAIYSYLNGKSCTNNPSSPCYPYYQQYQTCLNEYLTANQQFLEEDQQAGTGYTGAQESYLASLETCMNNASKEIISTGEALGIPFKQIVGELAIITATTFAAYKLAKYVLKLKLNGKPPISGNGAGNYARNLQIQQAVDEGKISPNTADSLNQQNKTLSNLEEQETTTFLDEVSAQVPQYSDLLSAVIAAEIAGMAVATEATEVALTAILA